MPQASPDARLLSVDVLRGLTIALMILVNDPGDWAHTYRQLDHAPWNGFTLTDFVFPNFLFLVGISIVLSLGARIRKAGGVLDPTSRRRLALHVLRRALLIFAIKMALTAYPHFHLTHLRIFGVLTRIAVCYLAAALLCLAVWNQPKRVSLLVTITAALLVGYWVLLRFVPVPGFGVPTHALPLLDPDANLAAWLDRAFNAFTQRWLHTGALYNHTRDPEGLLSTLPAIGTTLLGSVTGLMLVDRSTRDRVTRNFLAYGILLLVSGLVAGHYFPINKNLWTSSYVLFAGGWSLLLLGACHWLFDVRRAHESRVGRGVTLPWLIFGSNAITAFVLSNFIVETLIAIHLANAADPAHPATAWSWPYRHLFARHGSTELTSLLFAVVFTALCLLPNWWLWRRRIFLRV